MVTGARFVSLGWVSRFQGLLAAVVSVTLVASGLAVVAPAPASVPEVPRPLATYTAFPSADPDDGKFMAVAGQGLSTLAGIAVVAYIGVPDGTSSIEVGIFDGDTGGMWDFDNDFPVLNYRLYRDPLKNGSSMSLLAQWTSSDASDDSWYTRTFATDNGSKAPSGNYFYRLEANWANPMSTSFNNFKVRTTGQISLRAGLEFGFAGGPQNIGSDPCVGSGDPNPGDSNDADANTYDGDWRWFFYVPTVLTSIAFRDGDSDRADDETSLGAPPDGPSSYGPCANVDPSIYYTVTDPEDHVFTNGNPSGDTEWEDFTIGPSPGDDITIDYPLQPGLWQLRVRGMDAHNFNVLRANFEVYSTPDPPLTVNPTPLVEPDHERTTGDGVTLEYAHTVLNRGAPNSYDLRATSDHGWATRIYHDQNGNGTLDAGEPQVTMTTTLGTDESFPIVVQLDIPSGMPGNVDDATTVLASSRTEWAVQDDALDTTHVRVNEKPTARIGGPYTAPEGTSIMFDGGASSDPDGDPLSYRWDFQADGTWDTAWSPNTTASYTWGDDWTGTARVEVSDGNLTDEDEASVVVTNVAPAIDFTVIPTGEEGASLIFQVHVLDPGSDDVAVTWSGSCQGWSSLTEYPNDPAAYPDPDPSPDVHPRDVTDSQTVVCGDNGAYEWSVRVEDDDSGVTTAWGTFTVDNLPPALSLAPPTFVTEDEGTTVVLSAAAVDPGSDDLSFGWTWEFGGRATPYYNDGAWPEDPANSPNGTFPFTASETFSITYGDDGTYRVGLRVADDDGAFVEVTTTIEVRNVAPTVDAGGDGATVEGSAISLTFSFMDPGYDQANYGTVEDFTATVDWGYGAPENPEVIEVPGGPGVPTAGVIPVTHLYGDNGVFTVTVAVCDDDGGCGSDSMSVTVRNVDPSIADVQAYVIADLTLRVAGEKWHDVRMDLAWDDVLTGTAGVTRYPGSPDEQSATIQGGRLQLLGRFRITLYYTPDDDPVNGNRNGANPVWVILTMPDGTEVRLHHTFNVRHPETWTWTLDDLSPYLAGQAITFEATASDVGSDDLTFAWSFGDGASAMATHFNDGVGPDPFPSPEVNPVTATDVTAHAFGGAGTYTVTLTVTDDDGGLAVISVVVTVG